MKQIELTLRELDALLAEKVMGLGKTYYDDRFKELWYHRHKKRIKTNTPYALLYKVPEYTTDMNATMEIVEKINPLAFNLELCSCHKDPRLYIGMFFMNNDHFIGEHKVHSTAVSIGAAKTIGYEVTIKK